MKSLWYKITWNPLSYFGGVDKQYHYRIVQELVSVKLLLEQRWDKNIFNLNISVMNIVKLESQTP